MNRIEFGYRIDGLINAQWLNGAGRGMVDAGTGIGELEVSFSDLPEAWDPRTIVLMCCSTMNVMGTRAVAGAVSFIDASGGRISIGRHVAADIRRAKVVDDSGKVLVDVEATSLGELTGPEPFDHSTVRGGISRLVPGVNGIRDVRRVDGVLQQVSPHQLTLATRYEIALEDDTTAYGHTYYPYYLPEPRAEFAGPQAWRMEQVTQEFDGKTLWVQVLSSTAPLVEERSVPAVEAVRAAFSRRHPMS